MRRKLHRSGPEGRVSGKACARKGHSTASDKPPLSLLGWQDLSFTSVRLLGFTPRSSSGESSATYGLGWTLLVQLPATGESIGGEEFATLALALPAAAMNGANPGCCYKGAHDRRSGTCKERTDAPRAGCYLTRAREL
jgi:hypothetical protein